MKEFLRKSSFLLVLFSFLWIKSEAQVTSSFNLPDDVSCAPFTMLATATESSPFPVLERVWTLTGPIPNGFFKTPLGVNQNFSYIANIPGNYCLKLWSRNTNGDVDSITQCNIIVAANPTINFSFVPAEGCLPFAMSAICNSTPGSGTLDYMVIDWGCGTNDTFSTCTSTPIPHTYVNCQPGCIDPTVVIFNSYGCFNDSTYSDAICIIPKPIANFTANVTTVNCATNPLSVNFTADSAGPNMTYTWYINNVAVTNPNGNSRFFPHTFAINPNCYDIALKVQHPSSAGCSDSMSRVQYICVRPLPVISFTQNTTTACVRPGIPATLTFTNTSAGTPVMTWSLSGGTPPQTFSPQTGNNPSFTITNTGTYTVTVTGSFGGGCSTTVTQQALVVNLKPTAAFTMNDSASCTTPFQVTYNAAPCTGCTYTWTLAGANTVQPTGVTTNATYNNFNQGYNSTLLVTAPNGCTDTRLKVDAVKITKLIPRMSISKAMGCAPICATFDNITPLSIPGDSFISACWTFPGSIIPGACQDTIKRCFTSVGKYDVKLKVTTLKGCVDSVTFIDTIKVSAAPVCSVTATPTTMCFEEDSVCFTLACDSFDFAFVDYGDGVNEIVYTSAFCHNYQDTGTFHPLIIAFNDSCKGDTLQSIVINILPPIAKFIDSVSCGGGSTVYLRNQSIGASSFMWYFCTGDSSSVINPSIQLPPCDTCMVTLKATHPNGCVHQKTLPVVPPCTAPDMTPRDTVGCAPFFVNFKNLSINNDASFTRFRVCGSPPSLPCNFGNTPCVKAGDSVTHNYTAPGVYNICMRTKTGNCEDLITTTVRVCDITANFSPTSVCFPLPVNFKDLSTDAFCGGPTSWLWNFGDGVTDTNQNPSHTYNAAGTFQVTLTVTNSAGCSKSITKTVTAAPVNISYIIDSIICPGKQGCVINTSTGASLSYTLIIPNALPQDTFTTPNPCYSFAAPGDYPAYLHISSAGQCDFYDTVMIHNRAPIAAGTISDTYISCPNPPSFIQFYDTSLYADSTTIWDFGDGSSTSLDSSNHIYSLPGSYEVLLTVTTKDGCVSSRVIDTIVVDGPYGDFGFSPPGMCSCKDTIVFTVNTVNSSNLTLVYGCNSGFSQINPITPMGTAGNPTSLSFQVPYCLTDSCQPQLIFGDTSGCQVYIGGSYAYVDSPVVSMGFDNYGICVQGTVCFQDITTYTLPSFRSYTIERIWDFGDGTFDSTGNTTPCHYYDSVGGYNVKLYIRSNWGCFDSIVSQVVIVPEFPIAGFYPDDSLVCAETPMCFHDTSWIYPLTGPDYWVVNFGDGSIDTFQTPDFCHAYTTGGYYQVTMCVYDSIGCPDCDSSVVIRVIDNPVANAGPDRAVCSGAVTQLNGTGGSVPQWEPGGLFSDPNIYNPTIQLFNDTTISFYVGDQYGCRDTDYVVLSIAQVFADFTVGASFCEKVPVCVTDASTNTNGTLVGWVYDFGDSLTQLGPDTCHSYQTFGSLPITLIVTDNNGCKDTVTKPVTILPSPDAAISLNDTVICSDQALCVTDLTTSTAIVTSWQWYYGTVYSSTSPTPPCYTFLPQYEPTYNIVLVVIDQNTCRDTTQLIVTLNVVPNADFSASAACETDLMPFTNNSQSQQGGGNIIGCEWLFWVGAPNPVTSNICNALHQFPAGTYPVQLVVTDEFGCTDTIVKTVMSDTISQLTITPGDTTICLGEAVSYSVSGVFDNLVWQPNVWIDDPNASTVVITPLANISYTISATNGVCTAASDTFSIRTIQPIPIEVMATPEQVVLGLSSTITSQIGGQIDSIIWSPDATLDCRECPNPIALPTQTTTYTANIYYSENGITCTSSDSVTITVLAVCDNSIIFIPNTFTPNGDGLNDFFMIRGLAATRINHFRVFDRWGKLMFETEGGEPNETKWGWDGTDPGGEKLNSAVYVYTYEIECINGDIVKGQGNVTLLR
jgi:gliding motility-associated-like protein